MIFSHQVTALAMMAEKECGVVQNAQFPSLWEPLDSPGSIVQSVSLNEMTCNVSVLTILK
jgi:hypothetical protein